MTIGTVGDGITVERVTNQSTGYCPEPESWEAAADALDQIPVEHPDCFDPESVFRRCPTCSQINIVKDQWFVCGVCQSTLPALWNFV
ncbi:hypothetical protein Pla100_53650 [Neorhodopirellula pilleata]|uniref:Uncharacterized protein n=1 Tax=Neorhodopirellula pilleata TaxID=2714738 RepID=A0A5C5ZW35_9BACT|nr:hypothetical protein Pla100_53650 [Neorhodopirellula pilleata]